MKIGRRVPIIRLRTSPPCPDDSNAFIAYEIHPNTTAAIEPAPIARDWMDNAHLRHPVPLPAAGHRQPVGLGAALPAASGRTGTAGPSRKTSRSSSTATPDNRIISHFGIGRHHVHRAVPVPHAARHQPVGEGPGQLDQGRRAAAGGRGRDRLDRVHVHDELEDHPRLRVGAVREGRAVLHAGAGAARPRREPRAAAGADDREPRAAGAVPDVGGEPQRVPARTSASATRRPSSRAGRRTTSRGRRRTASRSRRTRPGSTFASSRSWRRRRSRPPRGRGS